MAQVGFLKNFKYYTDAPYALKNMTLKILVAPKKNKQCYSSEMESSKTSLASRTHFEVLGLGLEDHVYGLGLEASSHGKLFCPRLEDSTTFCTVEILLENPRNLEENLRRPFLFSAIGNRLKNFIIIAINGQR